MADPTRDFRLNYDWPLMKSNFAREDLDTVIRLLQEPDPILTQFKEVRAFEQEWSAWLGVKHSVFVNSGSSANLITMAVLRQKFGGGEIIVPTLTWSSDIASVLQNGFTPIFVDINPRTLGMDTREVISKLTPETRAVFLTHVLGYNALDDLLLAELKQRNIVLIEDVCESHGATFKGRKLGTYGLISNFSFFYAHHITTIEGGMACTDDPEIYEMLRMFRSHGMLRECDSEQYKKQYKDQWPDLSPDFIFMFPAYNVRSTELNGALGRSQLKRLDDNNRRRTENLRLFLDHLDPEHYRTDFAFEGSCNYGLTLVLKQPDMALRDRIERELNARGVQFRRGTAGGGNQLRQPYLRKLYGDRYKQFPQVDHVHFFGCYLGNHPDLDGGKIRDICAVLNHLAQSPQV